MTNNSHTTGILCENLVFSYGKRTILDNLSFSVQTGDFCVLTGESGSGKTTLLQCVGALESPSAGEITVKGNPVTKLRGKQKRVFLRNTVGFVFQNAGVIASWTVQKNLEVGGKRVRDNLEETTSEPPWVLFRAVWVKGLYLWHGDILRSLKNARCV